MSKKFGCKSEDGNWDGLNDDFCLRRRMKPDLQPMHFWAISLFVQTQELEALLLTVLHLPPRCGIDR